MSKTKQITIAERVAADEARVNGYNPIAVVGEDKDVADATCAALTVLGVDIQRDNALCGVVCSYDINTRDGAIRRERAECDALDNGAMYINQTLDIIAFTATATSLPDDTGELKSVPILTLEMSDGRLVNL